MSHKLLPGDDILELTGLGIERIRILYVAKLPLTNKTSEREKTAKYLT